MASYGELASRATQEERAEVHDRVIAIIGTAEQAKAGATDLSDRIKKAADYRKAFERLAKVFFEKGAVALAMHFVDMGGVKRGVTASGKKWELYMNNGYTTRSLYCGTLYIEGIGCVFTSGRIDKVFEYILEN